MTLISVFLRTILYVVLKPGLVPRAQRTSDLIFCWALCFICSCQHPNVSNDLFFNGGNKTPENSLSSSCWSGPGYRLCVSKLKTSTQPGEMTMFGWGSKPAVSEIVCACNASTWNNQHWAGECWSLMEAVIFDCHYKKKWSSYWYCGNLSAAA